MQKLRRIGECPLRRREGLWSEERMVLRGGESQLDKEDAKELDKQEGAEGEGEKAKRAGTGEMPRTKRSRLEDGSPTPQTDWATAGSGKKIIRVPREVVRKLRKLMKGVGRGGIEEEEAVRRYKALYGDDLR
eukprot:763353-Hanusia_phi.AAC.3